MTVRHFGHFNRSFYLLTYLITYLLLLAELKHNGEFTPWERISEDLKFTFSWHRIIEP